MWQLNEESPSSVKDVWKVVCGAPILPRVKLFAWRACLDALPTHRGLHRRVRNIDAMCSMCGRDEETAFHAIYECGFAQGVWEASELDAQLPRGCSSIVDWWVLRS